MSHLEELQKLAHDCLQEVERDMRLDTADEQNTITRALQRAFNLGVRTGLRAEVARLTTELANLRAQIESEQRTKEHSYGIGLAVVCFTAGFLMGVVWFSL